MRLIPNIKELDTLFAQIEFLSVLNVDLYATFRAIYKGQDVVVKMFFDMSDDNHEYEILEYLQVHSKLKSIFPRPILQYNVQDVDNEIIIKDKLTISEVRKIIIYQYFEGVNIRLNDEINTLGEQKYLDDITKQLNEIHRLGIIHADVHLGNIVQKSDGTHILIDYGSAFSFDWKINSNSFQPLLFMFQENDSEVCTQQHDFDRLHEIFSS